MNILVLGAAGFIGTNLALRLIEERNSVTLVDSRLEYFNHLPEKIRDKAKLAEFVPDEAANFGTLLEGQDVVYHLVSTTVPITSNQQIAKELHANVVMAAKFLDACVSAGIKRVIFISSGGTVYGKESSCPLKEDAPTNPISSYGIQKVTIEKLLYLYNYLYGLDYRVARLANPYGPYQRPNGILGAVTTFTYKALKKEEIIVYGDGSVVRDFIYIDDAIKALINISNSEAGYKVFNVGCGYGTSIKELLKIIEAALGLKVNVQYMPGRKVDVPVNYLDVSRYEEIYGKLGNISLEEGIKRTAEFLRQK